MSLTVIKITGAWGLPPPQKKKCLSCVVSVLLKGTTCILFKGIIHNIYCVMKFNFGRYLLPIFYNWFQAL